MKAKSKVLLGLIVALAMVVFAVPAFAAVSFTVSAPDKAEQEVFVGDKASFSFDIADASGADTDTYTVAVTDTNTTSPFTPEVTPAAPITGKNVKVTVTVPATQVTVAGEHTLKYKVTKTAGTGTGTKEELTQVAKVTVKDVPTATLTGATAGAKTLQAGDAINLNVTDITPADASDVEYQWQISNAATEANVVDSDKWTDMTGDSATKSTLSEKATVDMDGKFVRCVVAVDGKEIVANDGAANNPKYCAALTVTDEENIAVTVNDDAGPAKDSYEYFIGATPAALTPDATGGPTTLAAYTYTWTKDGKEVPTTVATVNTTTGKLTFVAATENTAGTYVCTAAKGDVKGESDEITIEVKATPTLTVKEATGTDAEYVALSQKAGTGVGAINVAAEDMENALTLTSEATELTPKWTKWFKVNGNVDTEISEAANKSSYTVAAGSVTANDSYKVQVGFEGLDNPLTYTVTIKEVSGSLDGDLLTSADGTFASASLNPDYTITLPEGLDFKKTTSGASTDLATDYGVTISPALTGATFNVTVTKAEGDKPATLKFTHTAFTDATAPVVKPMVVTVTDTVAAQGSTVIPPATINLPVDEKVGYKITLQAKGYSTDVTDQYKKQIELKGNAAGAVTETYTGEAIEPEVVAAANVTGLGKISENRYVQTANDAFPQKADIEKATADAPVDAGTYWVICDIEDGDEWSGNEGQVAGKLVIAPVTLSNNASEYAEKNAPYFKVDPSSKVYNGENQTPEVTFADDVEHAGKIDKVKYMQGTTEVTPLNVGKYDVMVKTVDDAADTIKNINNTGVNFVKVGEFEITKVAPTPDLYTMKPTEVTYTGAEQEPAIVKADDKAGDVEAVHYYKDGSEDELEGKPVQAGVYTVTIETKESDTYAAATGEDALELGTFTIKEEKSDQQDIYMIGHVQDIGWGEKVPGGNGDGKAVKLEAGKTAQVGTTGLSKRVEAVTILVPEDYTVEGFAHVQDVGDLAVAEETDTSYITNMSEIPDGYVAYKFGTTGNGKRVEAVNIAIKDADGKYVDGFEYATHIQNQGWLGSVRNGSFSGSRGMALRMEAIRFYYDDQIRKPSDIDAETK